MKPTIYPTLKEALYFHDLLLQRFGGRPGVLDLGLLESALTRPPSGYYGTVSEQAAALMQSLAINHPFVDGNRRIAVALTAVFLKLNGLNLTVKARVGVRFIEEELISKRASLETITGWIEKHAG
ncbi:MAG: Death on curing protein Doc toxin [Pseudomonadota bacterium]|jgi:death-on-curing protein